jgi:hypothetical protein
LVPKITKEAYELDKENGNTYWADAIQKEIDSLLAKHCFEFHAPGYKPSLDYHFATLNIVYVLP